ncbi:hypothetical protein QN277_026808 [Acacia crassicarpa]|uniref:Exopolygalacturonase-like n=1 Tax=Acacia crassicarpa TaxID=499986 RepID=A0AAE1JA17_9FABA|nr:hypothetical protein QN277_026808 [Acacia crassicarpa]
MKKMALSISIAVVTAYMATFRISAAMAPVSEPGDESPAENSRAVTYYDVTKYRADSSGKAHSSSAFLAAWEDACSDAGNSVLLIPEGTYLIGPISFSGPCKGNQSPKIEIAGTLKALSSPRAFQSSDWIVFEDLNRVNLTGINGMAMLDGQGSKSWTNSNCHKTKNCPSSLKFENVSYGTVSNINLIDSKFFHVQIYMCDNINLSKLNIKAPANSPNTDGIHISHSSNVNITSSIIGVGDDCVSIIQGVRNVTINGLTCGPGHGISIGSLGTFEDEKEVSNIIVQDSTLVETDNGLRIKAWPDKYPGKASYIFFSHITMDNVENPIIIDEQYQCDPENCKAKPSLVKLSNIFFSNINGTSSSPIGVDLRCSRKFPCENVVLDNVDLKMEGKPVTSRCVSVKPSYVGKNAILRCP